MYFILFFLLGSITVSLFLILQKLSSLLFELRRYNLRMLSKLLDEVDDVKEND